MAAVFVIGLGVALASGQVKEVLALSAGICDRTSQVSAAIAAAGGAPGCAQVTEYHLREVRSLDLSGQGISSLQEGDLDGLVRLDSLDLSDNTLTELPDGLFDELYLLRSLRLDGNRLTTVPSGIFDEMVMLEELTLSGNASLSLPAGLFEEFSRFAGMGTNGAMPTSGGSHPLIEGFIERNEVTTVEEFIAALPDLYKERFTLMYQSEAAAKDHVSYEHPRIISFGGDGRFTFAWNTDPDAPDKFRQSVEFLRQNESDWSAGVVDFSGDTPTILEPASCQSCHGSLNKPLWGIVERWEGSEFALPSTDRFEQANEAVLAAINSSEPRLQPLDFPTSYYSGGYPTVRFLRSPGHGPYVLAVEEVGAVWSWRHAEVLFSILAERKSDFRAFSEDLMCRSARDQRHVLATEFDPAEHHLFVSADTGEEHFKEVRGSNGEVATVLVNAPVDVMRPSFWYTYDSTLADVVTFLVLADLWQQEPIVRKLYRETSNVDALPAALQSEQYYYLYYEAGAANAEDELIQKLRMHFGRGNRAALDARAYQNARQWFGRLPSAVFRDGHTTVMSPLVCQALRDSKPQNLRATLTEDGPVLTWDSPDYDPESPTGYRILRGVGGQTPTVYVSDTGTTATTWIDENPVTGDIAYAVQAVYGRYPSPESNRATTTVDGPPLTAEFHDTPQSYHGGKSVSFELRFSEEVDVSYLTLRDRAFDVTDGRITAARRVEAPSNVRWRITVETVRGKDLSIVLPASDDCEDEGAVCTADSRPLSNRVELTVPGAPLTAEIVGGPKWNSSGRQLSFDLRFSAEVDVSYVTLRDSAFTVTGGRVVQASRLEAPSNIRWRITVKRDSDETVTVVLPISDDCDAEGAVCTADGRPLSNRLELTVPVPG